MPNIPLDDSQIAALLKQDATRSRTKKDPTAERTAATWFKLPHNIIDFYCQNPVCKDPRVNEMVNECSNSPKFHSPDCNQHCNKIEDRGRKTTVEVKGTHICRYCFMDGFLAG